MSDAQPSPIKRIGFSLPFFKKKADKPVSAEKAEIAKRKALIDEGHRYLSETTELVHENRDHQYMRANGYFTMFQERWSELYGMAPTAKKAKKGKMLPEEFRDHSRDLLDDVHSVLQNGKIEPRGSPSSQSHQTEVPHEHVHENPVTLE
ncbi:hypothetical protein BDZ94DRAFT_1062783 [Collybia nuda]|uniref:Uncharacterized protein n=1 Tax=Collybia nuda TaxID=64659 RepID=A0A9P5Y0G5_9AGAR|nr:hypothetical protein BDZ94DRAFT_1062783 [Collybia nuda]